MGLDGKKRTPNKKKPKKPKWISSYNRFVLTQRERIVLQFNLQGATNNDVNRKIAEVWRGLTVEEKKPYEDFANAAKVQYLQECARAGGTAAVIPRLNPPAGFNHRGEVVTDGARTVRRLPKEHRKKTGYTLFVEQEQPKIRDAVIAKLREQGLPTDSRTVFGAMNRQIGERWKNSADKKLYTDASSDWSAQVLAQRTAEKPTAPRPPQPPPPLPPRLMPTHSTTPLNSFPFPARFIQQMVYNAHFQQLCNSNLPRARLQQQLRQRQQQHPTLPVSSVIRRPPPIITSTTVPPAVVSGVVSNNNNISSGRGTSSAGGDSNCIEAAETLLSMFLQGDNDSETKNPPGHRSPPLVVKNVSSSGEAKKWKPEA